MNYWSFHLPLPQHGSVQGKCCSGKELVNAFSSLAICGTNIILHIDVKGKHNYHYKMQNRISGANLYLTRSHTAKYDVMNWVTWTAGSQTQSFR